MVNETGVQYPRFRLSGKKMLMRQRRIRGSSLQRSVGLPVHLWELIDRVSELQTAAYFEMGGKTKYHANDLIEAGVEMYIQSIVEDFGQLPETAEERKAFVKKLTEANRKSLIQQVVGKKQ